MDRSEEIARAIIGDRHFTTDERGYRMIYIDDAKLLAQAYLVALKRIEHLEDEVIHSTRFLD